MKVPALVLQSWPEPTLVVGLVALASVAAFIISSERSRNSRLRGQQAFPDLLRERDRYGFVDRFS